MAFSIAIYANGPSRKATIDNPLYAECYYAEGRTLHSNGMCTPPGKPPGYLVFPGIDIIEARVGTIITASSVDLAPNDEQHAEITFPGFDRSLIAHVEGQSQNPTTAASSIFSDRTADIPYADITRNAEQ